jgi:ABC-type amino acid transport substrate-binding protein
MGLVAELGQAFEAWLNAKYAKGHLKIHVVFLPAARDALLPDLTEGKGDVIASELTITPERQAVVDFATPWVRDVKEVLVAGPSSPRLARLTTFRARRRSFAPRAPIPATAASRNAERGFRSGRKPFWSGFVGPT